MLRRIVREGLSRLRGEPSIRHLEKRGLKIGRNVNVGGGSRIDYTYCHLIEIEDDVTLGPEVMLLAHDASRVRQGLGVVEPVKLGRGCFIGARAIILPGVTVGAEAIVGAGSVVTRSVAPGAVVYGISARVHGLVDGEGDSAERQELPSGES